MTRTPSRQQRAPERTSLTIYLDDAGSFDLLDADREREQARHVVDLRRAYWRAAFIPAGRVATTACIRDVLDGNAPAKALDAVAVPQDGEVAPAALDALVAALQNVDPDARVLDRLAEALDDGNDAAVHPAIEALAPDMRHECHTTLRRAKDKYLRARNRFMCANLRLVVTVAKRYGRHHLPLADRVQEGNLGLLKAVERFDPERGVRFSTYAAWWIRHAVTRALVKHGRTVRIPAHIHALFTKVRRARAALHAELGRPPTLHEVAQWIDVPIEKAYAAVDAMELRAVGFHEPASGTEGGSIGDRLQDDRLEDWCERIGERIDSRLADEVVDGLDPMAFDIVVRRFGLRDAEPVTLRALGEKYDVSRERIRQLQNDALHRLRDRVERSAINSLGLA